MVVYVAHPYRDAPAKNVEQLRRICRDLALAECTPLAPPLFVPQFLDEGSERQLALSLCLRLVGLADELHVYAEPTAGMQIEIAEAERLGIPVVHKESL